MRFSLHKHLEASEHRFSSLKQTGFELTTEALRDDCMKELLNRGQDKSVACMKLQLWESAWDDDAGKVNVKKGKDALTQAVRARAYARKSGRDFDNFRNEISNGHIARSREQPCNASDANRQMQYYKPLFRKKKKDEGEAQVVVHIICNQETVKNQEP